MRDFYLTQMDERRDKSHELKYKDVHYRDAVTQSVKQSDFMAFTQNDMRQKYRNKVAAQNQIEDAK